ncbi:A/G-specific adenine glycosylase [Bacillus massiliigorillae]|uniref:A/G-specific adenine glycosylase n=1 Tax=Bacillus massiliigorillae TaxID=1243664 RepID=UPI0003A70393|nr:A/G-specific adenine glycosylase [Bacillus massiliigorillae]
MHEIEALDKFKIEEFQQDLIQWFEQEQRSLPWRADRDPYKVWVSEIMLQQTRVDTVIPYFNRFMEWFPTLQDFADADEEKILKAWEGLGYYSRVRNLQSAVREVKENYGGVVPKNHSDIISLKGVGPYTAGAILSIAYGIPEPAVDGNVMRVLSRILLIKEDIAKPKTRKIFEDAVRALISHDNPSYFNQALMELGALICTPGTPACMLCPVREHCVAFAEGVQAELPIKTKVTKTKKVKLISGLLKDEQGRILVQKRPEKGLLANLWEFPSFSFDQKQSLNKNLFEDAFVIQYNSRVLLDMPKLTEIQHVFSHLVWNLSAYTGLVQEEIAPELMEKHRLRWVTEQEMTELAFPVPYQKMFSAYLERDDI